MKRSMKMVARSMLAGMVVAATTGAALAQPAPAGDVLRVYDVRDLGAYAQTGLVSITPRIDQDSDGLFVLGLTALTGQTSPQPDILMEVAGLTGLSAKRLQEGIYVATGPAESHEQLMAALAQYRTISGVHYVVELAAYESTQPVAAVPGDSAASMSGPAVFQCRQTVAGRASAAVAATSSEQYVSGWVPVVGNSAVGYQVQTSSAETGLTGTLVIGAGEAPEGRVNIQLAGWALKTDVTNSTITLGGDTLPLGTAKRQERGIQTSLSAPVGESIVLATISGFQPGSVVILTAKVTPVSGN